MKSDCFIHVLMGGPEYDIEVNGKRYHFEMHRYCGPVLLKKNGDPSQRQPMEFLEAASFWAQQGQKVENGLCIWKRTARPVVDSAIPFAIRLRKD